MVTTSDRRLYERLLLFRNHGITRQPSRWSRQEGPWYYEMQELGFNYRLTDIQCALGLSQLGKIEQFLHRREELARRYDAALEGWSEVSRPDWPTEGRAAWHLYVIRLRKAFARRRREVFNAMREAGIGVNVHYIPVYLHPFYLRMDPARYYPGLCPKAEAYYEEAMTLPLFPSMTDGDVDDVVDALHAALEGRKMTALP